MTEYTAKKVIFKNRDNEYLIPYIDNVYTKEEIDELLKDLPSGGGGSDSDSGGGGDTLPLYTGMYFDFTPNNVFWLGAGVQKSGEMYKTAYRGLVNALNGSMSVSTLSSNTVTESITPTKVGTVNDDPIETQAYYFSENDYLSTTLKVGSEPFELQFKFRTLTDVTTPQGLIKDKTGGQDSFGLIIKNGSFYCNMWEERITQCVANTDYIGIVGRGENYTYFKFSTDGGESFTNFQTGCFNPATVVLLDFGAPVNTSETGAVGFKGTIDLTNFVLTSTETQEETTDIIFDGKVIDVEAMVDGVDYSEYWKVDQNAMTFTTPTKATGRILIDKKEATENDPSWYYLYSDGWLEQGSHITGSYGSAAKVQLIKGYKDINYTVIGSGENVIQNTPFPLTDFMKVETTDYFSIISTYGTYTDFTWYAFGYTEAQTTSNTANSNFYFKVANAVENLELLDVGFILENMVDKQNMSAVSVCIEEYVNGTSGYRIYSDVGNGKWCEQWGIVTTSGDNYVAFLKKYKDENFIPSFQRRYIGQGTKKSDTGTANRNTIAGSTQYGVINGEGMYITVQSENGCTGVVWHTKGYLA